MTEVASIEVGAKGRNSIEVLLVFLKLGVSCFGGPIAHIGYFRDEFVLRRRWIDERRIKARSLSPGLPPETQRFLG